MSENWKIGDIAICVNVETISNHGLGNPPLRKGAEYQVNNVRKCECGYVTLDVGLGNKTGVYCECGALSSPSSGVWWCGARRFVKKKPADNKETDAIIEKALELTKIE